VIGQSPVAVVDWASNTYGSLEAPLFQNAHVAVLDHKGNAPDYVNPIGYAFAGGAAATQLSIPFAFKRLGAKSAVFFTRDFPAATAGAPVFATGLHNAGLKNLGVVAFPTNTTDFSPYAFKIKQLGADAVYMNTAFAQTAGIMKAAAQIGLKPMWGLIGGTITDVGLAQLPDQGEGLIAGNPTPSWRAKDPATRRFNREMTAAGFAADDARHRGGFAMAAWYDVYAFAGIARQVKGELTNESFLKELPKAKPVTLSALLTFDPRKRGPASFPRMFGSKIWFTVAHNGTLVPEPKLAPVVGLAANHLR
jgi:ABC-type branched-subunit amino acid transport system substrate-binding protein